MTIKFDILVAGKLCLRTGFGFNNKRISFVPFYLW